jgi:hypothetical protein
MGGGRQLPSRQRMRRGGQHDPCPPPVSAIRTFGSADDQRHGRQLDNEAAFRSSWDLGCVLGVGRSVRQQHVIPIDIDGLDVDQHDLHDHRRTHEHDRTYSVHVDGCVGDGGKHHPLPDAGGSGTRLRDCAQSKP